MKTYKNILWIHAMLLVTSLVFVLSGCGGDNGGTGSTGIGTVSGTAVKGPVSGGSVAAFDISNGVKGSQLGSAITDGQGNFSMTTGTHSGPLMLEVSGGTFTDEATGATMTMGANDVMRVAISSFSTGATVTGVHMTPLTSMAQIMASNMAGGMTTTNINTANGNVGNYFMVNDIIHTPPMNPLVPGSGTTASQDMRNYGMVIAAMSEYAMGLGMPQSSGMVTAMMDDASDGVMNGAMGSTPVSMSGMGGMMGGGPMQPTAGTSGLASAMMTFMTDTTVNRSGLTPADMQTLMDKLNTSNGTIQ